MQKFARAARMTRVPFAKSAAQTSHRPGVGDAVEQGMIFCMLGILRVFSGGPNCVEAARPKTILDPMRLRQTFLVILKAHQLWLAPDLEFHLQAAEVFKMLERWPKNRCFKRLGVDESYFFPLRALRIRTIREGASFFNKHCTKAQRS